MFGKGSGKIERKQPPPYLKTSSIVCGSDIILQRIFTKIFEKNIFNLKILFTSLIHQHYFEEFSRAFKIFFLSTFSTFEITFL
jgi:hypothetical protein